MRYLHEQSRELAVWALLALTASLAASCDDTDEAAMGGPGTCEVAGDGVEDTCYQDVTWDCGASSSHTFHGDLTCEDVGYPMGCCASDSDAPKYFRPSGGTCDANDFECGNMPEPLSACDRCLDTCTGDPLCCTGSGCYCESECS